MSITRLFLGTNCINMTTKSLKGLKWNSCFLVLHVNPVSRLILAMTNHAFSILLNTINRNKDIPPNFLAQSKKHQQQSVHFQPLSSPSAAKINWPWHTHAIGLPDSQNFFTKLSIQLFTARYSGSRPPGITNPSYLSQTISSNVAIREKLCPNLHQGSPTYLHQNSKLAFSVLLLKQKRRLATCARYPTFFSLYFNLIFKLNVS